MAMIFQTFALYPHLSTFDNLAYPLREQRIGADRDPRRVGEIAEMLRHQPHARAQAATRCPAASSSASRSAAR